MCPLYFLDKHTEPSRFYHAFLKSVIYTDNRLHFIRQFSLHIEYEHFSKSPFHFLYSSISFVSGSVRHLSTLAKVVALIFLATDVSWNTLTRFLLSGDSAK